MLKKLMLLAMALGALVAFSAPAASADEWWTETASGEETIGLGTANADEITFSGEIASTAGTLRNGPCEVHAIVDLWNEKFPDGSVTGTGEVTTFHIVTPCQIFAENPPESGEYVPLPGCEIEEAFSSTEVPWHINVLPGTKLDIENANFVNFNSEGCAAFGVPPVVGASGTVTGQGANGTNEFCIELNDSGHMETPTGVPVTLDGEVCANNLTLK